MSEHDYGQTRNSYPLERSLGRSTEFSITVPSPSRVPSPSSLDISFGYTSHDEINRRDSIGNEFNGSKIADNGFSDTMSVSASGPTVLSASVSALVSTADYPDESEISNKVSNKVCDSPNKLNSKKKTKLSALRVSTSAKSQKARSRASL